MKRSKPESTRAAELRSRAEERLSARKPKPAPGTDADLLRLVHELEVHQIELEMQNEELVATRREIEVGLARFRELFDFAPIGYFVIAADGVIRQVNLAGARLLGVERTRLVGRSFARFVHVADNKAFGDFLARTLASPEDEACHVCELRLLTEGAASPSEGRFTAVAERGQEATALLAVEDCTRRKQAEAELREEAQRKDAFIAQLSHELRNPLAPIRSSLHVLTHAEPGGERARKALAIVGRQLDHLTRIVDDLLDVTRIARGKVRLQCERTELGELVRHTMDDHRASFEARGIELQARFESELFWVEVDPTRGAQILGNLLGNALKFTGRGGKVEVGLRRDGPNVALSVRDTGVGLAPEERERIFEPFTQAPQSLARTRGGLGLGLAMVKGLTELHGGTVEAQSAGAGKGTEVTVRLPLARAPQALESAPGTHLGRQHKVLIVEDNKDAAESLADALELDGHEVRVADDGATALSVARDMHPDIVLCDLGLPDMSGYDVARGLRADDALKSAFLIALSGYSLPEDLRRCAEAGFDRHMAKPPSLEKLRALFDEAPAAGGTERAHLVH